MFRFGQLCKDCPGPIKCKDMPSEALPWNIRCVRCEGQNSDGCPECGGSGQIKITDCPEKLITPDIWEAIEMTEFWEKGLPPVAGGVLEQTHIFVCMARIIMAEKNYWKNKLGILW